MDKDATLQFWFDGSRDALETAEILVAGKKHHFGLFFCQLAIEKYLKGLIVRLTSASPLPTHDLIDLTKRAQLLLTPTLDSQLREISKFNIEARYDSIKLEFYKKSTSIFTHQWLKITQEILIWLKKQ